MDPERSLRVKPFFDVADKPDFCHWHKVDMPTALTNVRIRAQSGRERGSRASWAAM
jgi:hypothetical protein